MNIAQINKLYKEIAGSAADISELDIDVDDLLKTIENDKNTYLENTNLEKIQYDILNELKLLPNIKPNAIDSIYKRLVHYRFVDELSEIHMGKYVRWIRKESYQKNGAYFLTFGGFVVDIIFTDQGSQINIKTADNRFFKYAFDKCITFQRLSYDEQLILSIYEVVNK